METHFVLLEICLHGNTKCVSMKTENVFAWRFKIYFYEKWMCIGQKWIQNWSTVNGGEKGHKYLFVDGEKGYKFSTTNTHTVHKMLPNSFAQYGAK